MRTRSRILILLLSCLVVAGSATLARAQDLQSQIDQKQAEIQQQKERKGVLSSELAKANDAVDQLAGEVAVLRNREAVVVAELRRVQHRLNVEKERLDQLH